MKVYLPTIYCLVFSVLLLLISYPSQVHAATLSNSMVRLNSSAPNTSLSGLICAAPSSAGAGTEGRIQITFPSDFSISQTASNWTTGSSELPDGSTAWPGISSTAQSVSGNTVTFSSANLTSTDTFCFTFFGTSSTTGSTGAKSGTITTTTSGGSTIDTKAFTTRVGDDRIGVTARVAGQPDDFRVTIRRLTPSDMYGQDQDVMYEVSYSNLLPEVADEVALEINWSLGTVYGSSIPTVELLNYQSNSATTAYNGAPGIIDPLNRTITWTIGTIPANYTGTVHFTMHTNDTYQGPHDVYFDLNGRLLGLGIATPFTTLTTKYKYNFTPASTPGPTGTPAPEVPKEAPRTPFRLLDIDLHSVAKDSIQLDVLLSHKGTVRASYGLSPRSLTQQLTALNQTDRHTLTFPELKEDTRYYFRFIATDDIGRQVTSDIYTVITAKAGELPVISQDSLTATSEKTLLFTHLDKVRNKGKNFIIIPPQTIFEIQFGFEEQPSVRNTLLLVRNKNVLGMNTYTKETEAATNGISLLETKPNVFSGRLRSHNTPGYYDLIARVSDYNGNITEEKLADIKVSKPFLLKREDNQDPVEDARVLLSLYNERTRVFTPISSQILPITNPVYSNVDGVVPLVLPYGTYRAEISALGFEPKTIDFTLGANPDQDYPTVTLTKRPFNLLYGAQYILFTAMDLGLSLDSFVHDIGASKRVYNFTGFVVLTSFLLISILALSERMHVHPRHFPRYFLSLLKASNSTSRRRFSYLGEIHDGHSKEPLSDVDVIVTDTATGRIVFHIKSNISGKFRLVLSNKAIYALTLEKIGYHPATIHLHHLKENEEQQLALLEDSEAIPANELAHRFMKKVLTVSFEVTLLLTIGATMLLVFTIGFLPILPFLILSFFNLVFWALHEIHVKQ